LERVVLRFEREESLPQTLGKLEGFVMQYSLPLAETRPLFAALLSRPLSSDDAPLLVSPEQQKQQTLHVLLAILRKIAAQQPVRWVMEDLHGVDPTTLALLSLLVDHGPTACILALRTGRPDFRPPWTGRAHLTQVTRPCVPRRQATELTGQVARGKALPPEGVEHVVAKTDGVPLCVEELTTMVLESGLLQEHEARYELTGPLPPLAIPATVHDSLMARLDRLATIKSLAQLGATLGHELAYALLQAVAPWDERRLPQGLHQLVAAGRPARQRGLGLCGSHQSLHERAGGAPGPARHHCARPARVGRADRPRASFHRHDGLRGSGSRTHLQPGPGAVPAGRGDPAALPGAVGTVVFSCRTGRVTDRAGAE